MPQVMSGDDITRAIRRMSHQIVETHRGVDDLILVGIQTRGANLARQLSATLHQFEGSAIPTGSLVVDDYRDDGRGRSGGAKTSIPVSIDGMKVLLVDDVLYTGRTVRAALDALSDLGRSAVTELAVLVDRGHRELPIRADYVGKNLPTAKDERVWVRLTETDGVEGVWVERVAAA